MRRDLALAKKRIAELEARTKQMAERTAIDSSILAENKKFLAAQEKWKKNELKFMEMATECNGFHQDIQNGLVQKLRVIKEAVNYTETKCRRDIPQGMSHFSENWDTRPSTPIREDTNKELLFDTGMGSE